MIFMCDHVLKNTYVMNDVNKSLCDFICNCIITIYITNLLNKVTFNA